MRELRVDIVVLLQFKVVSREVTRRGALAPFTGGDEPLPPTLMAGSRDPSRV
jgi:hypothetical protein